MLLFYWLACTSASSQQEKKPPSPPVTTEENSAFSFEPEWTQEEVFVYFDELFALGMPHPTPFISMFKELYDDGGDQNCPGTNYNFDSPEISTSGCTSSSGMFFAGAAEFQRDTENEVDMHCDCRIESSDGRMVRGAGNFRLERRNNEMFFDIQGSFLATPNDAWLEELPSIHVSAWKTEDNKINLNGGWTVNNQSVFFDSFWFEDCPNGIGSIFLRDPSGLWWEWRLRSDCSQELYFNEEFQDTVDHNLSVFLQELEDILE